MALFEMTVSSGGQMTYSINGVTDTWEVIKFILRPGPSNIQWQSEGCVERYIADKFALQVAIVSLACFDVFSYTFECVVFRTVKYQWKCIINGFSPCSSTLSWSRARSEKH